MDIDKGVGQGADVGEGKGKDTDRGLSLIRINFDLLFSSENLLNHTLTKLLRCFFALVVLQSGSLYLYSYREYTH